jgi:hypothetical protein
MKILKIQFEKEFFISLFIFLGIITFECKENYVLKLFLTYFGKVDNG